MQKYHPASISRIIYFLSCFGITALTSIACNQHPEKITVNILPEGKVTGEICRGTATEIERVFACRISVLSPQQFPLSAWYTPRKRYRADKILEWLGESKRAGEKTLAITSSDISTTKDTVYDWGVFGLAWQPGCCAVISIFRLKPSAKSERHFIERVKKVALHETGHMFGLPHCENNMCVMTDAEGKVKKVDGSTIDLCNKCREILE